MIVIEFNIPGMCNMLHMEDGIDWWWCNGVGFSATSIRVYNEATLLKFKQFYDL